MTAALASLRGNSVDIIPAPFSSIASSYSGNNAIETGHQMVSGINSSIALRVFWSMSGNVRVYVTVNGVSVADTGGAMLASGSFDITLAPGDVFYVGMIRNANRTGFIQLLNLIDASTQLSYISVTIT